jgi:predicted branched-subunit amino acid permease
VLSAASFLYVLIIPRLLLKHLNTCIVAFLLSDHSFVAAKMVYRSADADYGEWLGFVTRKTFWRVWRH